MFKTLGFILLLLCSVFTSESFGAMPYNVVRSDLSFVTGTQTQPLYGEIGAYKFGVAYNPGYITNTRIDLEINTWSIILRYPDGKSLEEAWDNMAKSPMESFFVGLGKGRIFRNSILKIPMYPTMTFKTKDFVFDENTTKYKVIGQWTMLGETHDVEMFLDTVGFITVRGVNTLYLDGEFTVDPKKFSDMGEWDLVREPWKFKFSIESVER